MAGRRLTAVESQLESLLEAFSRLQAENKMLRDRITVMGSPSEWGAPIGVSDLLQVNSVKPPTLGDLEKETIRNFLKSYEDYMLQCPETVRRKPQALIRTEFLNIIAAKSGVELVVLCEMNTAEFAMNLCGVHAVTSLPEMELRLKFIRMKKEDLAFSTFINFCEDWNFEIKCLGAAIKMHPKRLAKLFINGLKPTQLQYVVRISEPSTVEEAKAAALAQLDMLRAVKDQAKYFRRDRDELSLGRLSEVLAYAM
jgi:hypothetical protein